MSTSHGHLPVPVSYVSHFTSPCIARHISGTVQEAREVNGILAGLLPLCTVLDQNRQDFICLVFYSFPSPSVGYRLLRFGEAMNAGQTLDRQSFLKVLQICMLDYEYQHALMLCMYTCKYMCMCFTVKTPRTVVVLDDKLAIVLHDRLFSVPAFCCIISFVL